jgi:hypothetical protein
LEKEKMIFELNQKVEQEKRQLEETINKKINSLSGVTTTGKKPKNEILEKIEEVNELKSIDDIMTIYNK